MQLVFLVTMLSAARNARDAALGESIYQRLQTLFPKMTQPLTSATVLLANTYSFAGEDDKASQTRSQLNISGAKKKAGLSWTSPKGILTVSNFSDIFSLDTVGLY